MFEHLPKERRRVLKALIAGGVAFFVAPFAYAIDKYLSMSGFGLNGSRRSVSKSELVSPGDSVLLDVAGEPVLVVHEPQGVRAFTATCTHMGCIVRYRAEQNDFYCKCHQGRFDKDGVNVPGTKPQSPLTELVVRQSTGGFEVVLTEQRRKSA